LKVTYERRIKGYSLKGEMSSIGISSKKKKKVEVDGKIIEYTLWVYRVSTHCGCIE
jgi:hypothetical protein